jgi:hypothetical protein
MRKGLFTLLLLFITIIYVNGQTQNDTIEINKNKYELNGKILTPRQMLDLMADCPDAYNSMKKANTNYNAAMVFGCIGGFCIGYPLGQAIGGGKPVWALVGVGAGFIAIAIPFNIGYNKNARTAARLYNSKRRQVGINKINFDLGFTGNGISLVCRF